MRITFTLRITDLREGKHLEGIHILSVEIQWFSLFLPFNFPEIL